MGFRRVVAILLDFRSWLISKILLETSMAKSTNEREF